MGIDAFPEFMVPYLPLIRDIVLALVIFIVGWIASKWAQSLVARALLAKKLDEALARFLGSLAQYTVLAAAVIMALQTVGLATTSLVALLASAGLAVGLALQGSLSHFASGVMILLFRPFTLQDKVTAGGHTGKVSDIGLFATTLLSPDNETIIIPNGEVMGGSIVNFTRRGTLRGNISIGVSYGTDIPQAIQVMEGAARRVETVLEDPAPAVAFVGFGASSLDFAVRPWANVSDLMGMLHDVRVALYDDLNAAGIEIPFDQIVVHKAGE